MLKKGGAWFCFGVVAVIKKVGFFSNFRVAGDGFFLVLDEEIADSLRKETSDFGTWNNLFKEMTKPQCKHNERVYNK